MDPLTLDVLPFEVASGAQNMAADETLLLSAIAGQPSFRCYGWREATVSLGYFQAHAVRNQNPQLVALPYVRRPTGGMTLVHHHELTYALALPAATMKQPAVYWLERVHKVIRGALREHGVTATLASADMPGGDDCLCFHHITRGDLTIAGAKVVGSAQRRHHGALLQHGAILFAHSPFTPTLPGIAQCTGKTLQSGDISTLFPNYLAAELGLQMMEKEWSHGQQDQIESLIATKYAQPSWNDRR